MLVFIFICMNILHVHVSNKIQNALQRLVLFVTCLIILMLTDASAFRENNQR
jgi:hypothetical protein